MQHNGWDHALKVAADGKGLVGHAGAVLLRKAADQLGLTAGLSAALVKKGSSPLLDRGTVLASLAVAIALGATSMSDIALLAHLSPVLGAAPSGPTVRRALDLAGTPRMLDRIARARAKARERAWKLIETTPAGFPWLAVAGKTLTGWLVTGMDATLVTSSSDKEGAAPTWKKGYGFHPLGAWCANTRECLHMLLRPGNAGSNTFTDHKEVLAAALKQVPARFRRSILVRVDGAGASHDLIEHLLSLSTPRKKVLFTCGWAITPADEDAIRQVPAGAWKPGTTQDGRAEQDKDVAEVTGLMSRAGNWPEGLRWIARRVKPSRRHLRSLTDYERKTGWKYSITCTSIPDSGIGGVPGQPPRPVHRRAAPRPRHRRDSRRPHRQGHGPAEPPFQDLAGQRRLGPRGEHRRRPRRLDPPPRPLRRRGTQGRRPGNAPLPDLAPARQARPPRPAEDPRHQLRLAMEGGVPHLLAQALRTPRTRLTRTKPFASPGRKITRRGRSRRSPGRTGQQPTPCPKEKRT
jgi:DDE family transposase